MVQESNFQNANDSLDQALEQALGKSQTNNLSQIMGSFDKAVHNSDIIDDDQNLKEGVDLKINQIRFEEEPTLQFSNIQQTVVETRNVLVSNDLVKNKTQNVGSLKNQPQNYNSQTNSRKGTAQGQYNLQT